MSDAARKECPFCVETIKAAARRCRFCGCDLPPTMTVAAPVSPPSVPEAPLIAPLQEDEVLDLLTSLVQKSLVVYEEEERGRGAARNEREGRLLETVRQSPQVRSSAGA